jgi:hypothetical protein
MDGECRCGQTVPEAFHLFGCLQCGTTCCSACAIHLESATYCADCAGSLLDVTTVRAATPFNLH